MSAQEIITRHLDLWTSAITHKSTAGRGTNGKIELTGIKKLRELILELAVRGKLLRQDSEDEPAEQLLAGFALQRSALIEAGKIRKSKLLSAISDTEHPFDLPEGWVYCRLNDLGLWGAGATPNRGVSEYYGGGIPWFKSGELSADFISESEESITKLALKDTSVRLNSPGDVLIAMYGATIGKASILRVPATTNQAVCACTPWKGVSNLYLLTLLKAYKSRFIGMGAGGAQPNISREKIIATVIPLPPEQEQHRIVEKVDELMALCDRLEQQTSDQIAAHETLVDALLDTLTQSRDATELADNWARLAANFDTLFTTEHSIERLKQTILQLAVMGRLVEQDPGDESAAALLNRLSKCREVWLLANASRNPECRTMLKKLSKLGSPTSPHSLPNGWIPAHLMQLSRILVDCHNKTAPYVKEGIPIIRTSNIRERLFVFDDLKYVDQETYTYWSRRCPPEPQDIIFTREAPMGEAAIIPDGKTWCLGQRTMLIRPMHEHINNSYLLLTLTEPHLLERAAEKAIGSTVKHLRVGDVENLVVPVPPLEEQHRIVQKVDELMAFCDQLKARLTKASETRLRLAETVTEQAIGNGVSNG